MKQGITIQERLKDLRIERHLKLEELAELTQISKSALGSYENDVKKEISHKSILKLAEFYGVSTDYLLCATENRNRPDAQREQNAAGETRGRNGIRKNWLDCTKI